MGMIKPYEDRKKLKWIGFFLSEHTTSVNKVEEERAYTYPPKPEMEILKEFPSPDFRNNL